MLIITIVNRNNLRSGVLLKRKTHKQGDKGGLTFHIINNLNRFIMVQLTGPLAKLQKKTRIRILAVDDDSSKQTDVLVVEMFEKMRIKGSNPLPNGKDMWWTEDKLYIAADDIPVFNQGVKEVQGQNGEVEVWYEGPLKLDVSKPRGSIVNGAWVWRTQPKLWLLSTLFSRRGSELIQNTQETMRGALNTLFAPPEESEEERKAAEAKAKAASAAGDATNAGAAGGDGAAGGNTPPAGNTGGAGGGKGRNQANVTG